MIRARDAMVRSRTVLINAARSLAKGFGVRLPKSITAKFGERARALAPPQLAALSRHITGYEKIERIAEQRCEVKRVTQVPGAGTLTALTFVLKLGRAERFTRSRDAASYRCVVDSPQPSH